ncbi:MAG TPA: hypothetical protein V6D29_09475 [Leptolyngbyaceae cyanobacterium]
MPVSIIADFEHWAELQPDICRKTTKADWFDIVISGKPHRLKIEASPIAIGAVMTALMEQSKEKGFTFAIHSTGAALFSGNGTQCEVTPEEDDEETFLIPVLLALRGYLEVLENSNNQSPLIVSQGGILLPNIAR